MENIDFVRVTQKCPTLGGIQEVSNHHIKLDMATSKMYAFGFGANLDYRAIAQNSAIAHSNIFLHKHSFVVNFSNILI